MLAAVDLNADLGEMPGRLGESLDAALLSVVTSANVACGGHAGDPGSMRRVALAAAAAGVSIGAHVSYPDRANFGRKPVSLAPAQMLDSLRQQMDQLLAAAASVGATVRYIKAHGALYNGSLVSDPPASILIELANEYRLPILTMAGGLLAGHATASGVLVYGEFFADRSYESNGQLRSREHLGAVITEPEQVVRRALRAVREGTVESHYGVELPVTVDSICVHGDTPGAVQLAQRVRDALIAHGVVVRPFRRADP